MTVNIGSFVFTLAKKIEATTDPLELTILTKAAAKLKGGTINSVYSFSLLPTITSSIYGDLYLVENENIIYWAHPEGWQKLGSIPAFSLVYTWGSNNYGQLGIGTSGAYSGKCSPVLMLGNTPASWMSIGKSPRSSRAIKRDGTLWSWGQGDCGVLGNSNDNNFASPVTVSGGGTTWCQTSYTRAYFASGIKTDGTLWTWGRNSYGQLGDVSAPIRRSSPGTVSGEGTNWCFSTGGFRVMAGIKTDGTLWTWGTNNANPGAGALGDNTTTTRVSPGTTAGGGTNWCSVSFSTNDTGIGIKTDGTLWTWGDNSSGQLGIGSSGTNTCRSSPGTVAGGGTTWCRAMGFSGIKTDGTLWTWGSNTNGQLGDGTTTNRSSPVTTAGGGTTWCFSTNTAWNGAGIKTDGTLWTWGNALLGDTNAFAARSSPGTTTGNLLNWRCILFSATATEAIAIRRFEV